MGKHGPCYHCGVTSTPLWRNGPPEKPVLCNACGSRWRTKGTLANYTPLHARAESDEFEDYRVSKVKPLYVKNKEASVLKRKLDYDITEFGVAPPRSDHSQGLRKGFDEDTSNRSSSGSAISNSESCAQYGSADVSDLTGPSQPIVWDTMVPSRKRTCVTRTKPSPVEKLTKDLYTIWHEQQSSCLSGSSEEDLLLESDQPMVSVEIGHGSVLIRHPNSIAREEESEASSLSIDKHNNVVSRPVNFPCVVEDTGVNSLIRGAERTKKPIHPGPEQERIGRDKDQLEKLHILAHHNSPLCFVDLQDIINFENFSSHLTNDEKQQMCKFLPSPDTLEVPDRDSGLMSSLKTMFDSPQFKENILSFQRLLANGVFDNSLPGVNSEDCRTLKKLILCISTKSKWVEKYKTLEDLKDKTIITESEVGGFNALATDHSTCMKKSRDGLQLKFSGSRGMVKSPRRIITNSSDDQNGPRDKYGSYLGGRALISLHNDNSSLIPGSSNFAEGSSDQDLLLDVPSNSSFPQAELLLPASSFGAQASISSSSVYPSLLRP